jgi:hypothetical protein
MTNHYSLGNMTTDRALAIVLDQFRNQRCIGDLRRALMLLQALREQQGCEHFDVSCTDGRLTTLCDIIMFG